jgi:hypothetical protein
MCRDDRLYLTQVMLAQGRDAKVLLDRQEHHLAVVLFLRPLRRLALAKRKE